MCSLWFRPVGQLVAPLDPWINSVLPCLGMRLSKRILGGFGKAIWKVRQSDFWLPMGA